MRLFSTMVEIYQFFWMLESHHEQRLAWRDAEEARRARIIAESRAVAQHRAMMLANPSGQLGRSGLGSREALERSGLL